MNRPEPGDCSDYFLGYTNLVETDDVLALLGSSLERPLATLAALDEERASFRYAPEKWSVKELVGHLADTERVFTHRAHWFARAHPDPLSGFEENDFNAATSFDARSLASILDELRIVRAATLSLFHNLSHEELERSGVAEGNRFVVRSIPWLLAGHEQHHLGVLAERYEVAGL